MRGLGLVALAALAACQLMPEAEVQTYPGPRLADDAHAIILARGRTAVTHVDGRRTGSFAEGAPPTVLVLPGMRRLSVITDFGVGSVNFCLPARAGRVYSVIEDRGITTITLAIQDNATGAVVAEAVGMGTPCARET